MWRCFVVVLCTPTIFSLFVLHHIYYFYFVFILLLLQLLLIYLLLCDRLLAVDADHDADVHWDLRDRITGYRYRLTNETEETEIH